LAHADIIAAEDTRRFADLARRASMEYHGRVVSYFEANESAKTPDLVNQMLAGSTIVLVTDAGMPSVSDPGFRLVTAAIDAGIIVSAIPGPSAVLTALAVSGIESDRFCFEGFLPRKPGPRASRLAQLAAEPRTMIFFEAPHRLADFLQAATGAFGPHRRGAICRELTKTYEQVVRGPLSELADWAEDHARGEITVVIAGAPPREPDIDELVGEVQSRMKAGEKRSAAVAAVALAAHADRRALYDATLKAAGRAS
jgi:16S rRNA (cytidine1402-2'-O)-methyltransferase